ncbi:MAG: hypothetical protein WC515_08310 [Candidatus Omnitrophota bacterium]
MDKIYRPVKRAVTVFVALSVFLAAPAGLAQEKEREAVKKGAPAITQGEVARLIGTEMAIKENFIERLKDMGITPLGEWSAEKPLTKESFDAILLRVARRSPVAENMEPDKLLEKMGLPPRDVSSEGVKKIMASDAFRKTVINPRLILCPPILPFPPVYKIETTVSKDILSEKDISTGILTVPSAAVELPPGPGPVDDVVPDDDDDDVVDDDVIPDDDDVVVDDIAPDDIVPDDVVDDVSNP